MPQTPTQQPTNTNPVTTKKNWEPYYFWIIIIIATATAVGLLIVLMNFKSQQEVLSSELNGIPKGLIKNSGGNKQSTSTPGALLKVCPEELIEDRMPTVSESPETRTAVRSYYIYQGVRREVAEFDASWVKANCTVKKTIAY